MPLLDFYKLSDTEVYLGVWEMEEPVEFFKEKLTLYPSELKEIKDLKERKLKEWYCSRYLLHLMSHREIRGACLKDQYGKPYIENSSYFISMSHSHNRTAVIASPHKVGIDIQFIVPKIERIAQRFLSKKEMNSIPEAEKIRYYHLYWGAKEVLYKGYGKKELDYKEHILIEPFVSTGETLQFDGEIKKNDEFFHYHLNAIIDEKFVLVYGWEIINDEYKNSGSNKSFLI